MYLRGLNSPSPVGVLQGEDFLCQTENGINVSRPGSVGSINESQMYQGDTQFDENCSIQVDPPRYDTLGRNYPGQTAHARPTLDAMARATAPQPLLPLATDHGQQSQGRLETESFQTHQVVHVPQSAHAQDMCNLTQLFQQMLSVQLSSKAQMQQELNEMKQQQQLWQMQQRAQQERLLEDTREQYDQFD